MVHHLCVIVSERKVTTDITPVCILHGNQQLWVFLGFVLLTAVLSLWVMTFLGFKPSLIFLWKTGPIFQRIYA